MRYGQRMKKLLLLLIPVVFIGCSSPMSELVKTNNANLTKLELGMTGAEVLNLMGPAEKKEEFETKTNGSMKFLFYRTEVAQIIDGSGKAWVCPAPTAEGEVCVMCKLFIKAKKPTVGRSQNLPGVRPTWTPICIIEGKLKGWGQIFYEHKIGSSEEATRKRH